MLGEREKLQKLLVSPADAGERGAIPEADYGIAYWFWCEGCCTHHSFRTKAAKGEGAGIDGKAPLPIWTFNGSLEKPTFEPSLLYRSIQRCHLYLREGVLEYLGDSSHKLAGKRVPLVPLP